MKNILIIGGSGTWSGKTHIESIKKSEGIVKLVAIMDYLNPYESNQLKKHKMFLEKNNVKWIKVEKEYEEELLKKCIVENDIDIVVISTPHEFHYKYALLCLKYGVDIICEKPIIATRAQSSLKEKAEENISKHNDLLDAIKRSENRKQQRKCYVLTPLRRRVQEIYANIYDSVNLIKNRYGQEVSDITICHNDGVFRFCNEVELNGAHGYSDGFGKLTHTGYHILDVAAALIENGCNIENTECVCKVINCNTIGDMIKSESYDINSKLLDNKIEKKKISPIALNAEMDISISYVLYHNNVKYCSIILNLMHLGKSNRTRNAYNSTDYNDQGRTNELSMYIQQGNLFSTQMISDTKSGSNGIIGDTYVFKNYHPLIATEINQKEKEVLNSVGRVEKTVDIVSEFYNFINNGNLKGHYKYINFSMQQITDELYMAALISKVTNKEYKWELGKIKK